MIEGSTLPISGAMSKLSRSAATSSLLQSLTVLASFYAKYLGPGRLPGESGPSQLSSKCETLGGCMDFKAGDLDFKAADLVRLISGSRRMTVEEVGTGTVVCVWREKGQIRRE